MKYLTITILMFYTMTTEAQEPKAFTERKTFSRTTSVSTSIDADQDKVWNILTNAQNFPSWNSTVISIDGEIKEGEKIKLKSTLDPSRTFKLKVKEAKSPEKLVWGDAMGQRTYLIEKSSSGVTFTMTEKIGGFLFPLFAKKIPSFDESFEQFARDLKTEAERI